MANHHHIKGIVPFLWTSGRGSVLYVFGKHNASICTLYLYQLNLANQNQIHASTTSTALQVDKKMSCCRMFLLTKLPKYLKISMLNNVPHYIPQLSFFIPFLLKGI